MRWKTHSAHSHIYKIHISSAPKNSVWNHRAKYEWSERMQRMSWAIHAIAGWEIEISIDKYYLCIHSKLDFIQFFFFFFRKKNSLNLNQISTFSDSFHAISPATHISFGVDLILFSVHYQFSYLIQLLALHIKWKLCLSHVIFFLLARSHSHSCKQKP